MGSGHSPGVIITIDGPAGTGKSTVAHLLACRLGLDFLDTGAMYRAAAVIAIERRIDPADGPGLARVVASADLRFDWAADPPRIMAGDRDLSRRVREQDVSDIVSVVAGHDEIRSALVEQQRAIATAHPRLVTEGRDQGSAVFPDASVRFYLDADAEVRADRRVAQLAGAGMDADRNRIVADIKARDLLDSTRAHGPLVRPVGADVIDTSGLSVEQVVDELEAICRRRLDLAP